MPAAGLFHDHQAGRHVPGIDMRFVIAIEAAIGGEAAMEAPGKTRARSTTKKTSTRAKKAGDGSTKKPTTQRTASKKTADSAKKPKRTRKKTEAPTTQTNKP